MKSTAEWLMELPIKYRSLALAYHSQYKKHKNVVPNCLSDALILAFKWGSTYEGKAFWADVYNQAKTGEWTTEKKLPVKQYTNTYVKKGRPKKDPKPDKVIKPRKKREKIKRISDKAKKNDGKHFDDIDSALQFIFSKRKP